MDTYIRQFLDSLTPSQRDTAERFLGTVRQTVRSTARQYGQVNVGETLLSTLGINDSNGAEPSSRYSAPRDYTVNVDGTFTTQVTVLATSEEDARRQVTEERVRRAATTSASSRLTGHRVTSVR